METVIGCLPARAGSPDYDALQFNSHVNTSSILKIYGTNWTNGNGTIRRRNAIGGNPFDQSSRKTKTAGSTTLVRYPGMTINRPRMLLVRDIFSRHVGMKESADGTRFDHLKNIEDRC